MTYSVPVMEAARGEARNAMRSATSLGLAGQRHSILNRGDMDDDAGALFDHRRQQRTIEAHGGEQVLIERHSP